MTYAKHIWLPKGTAGAFPVSASKLNEMEQGIADAHAAPAMRRQVLALNGVSSDTPFPNAVDGDADYGYKLHIVGDLQNPDTTTNRWITIKSPLLWGAWFAGSRQVGYVNADNSTASSVDRYVEGTGVGFYCGGNDWFLNGSIALQAVLKTRVGRMRTLAAQWGFSPDINDARRISAQAMSECEDRTTKITGLTVGFNGLTFTGLITLEPLV